MMYDKQYIECNPCRQERDAWDRELRADKSFMRWHGFRRYLPTDEYKERTPDHV